MLPCIERLRNRLEYLRHSGWMLAALGVFVVQNHCGVPGVAHDQLAAHFLDRGQDARALREAQRAIRESPDDPTPRVIASLALAGLGQTEAAATAVERALELDLDDPRLYGTLRSICIDADREDLALEALQRLVAERPGHWLLTLNLGWAHRAVGDDEQALLLLESAVANPDSAAPTEDLILAHFELSRVYAAQERLDDARRVLGDALHYAPHDPRLLVASGELHLRLQQPKEAEAFFEQAVAHSDAPGITASRIAMAFYNAGDRSRSILFYERAIMEHPEPLTLNNLAWTYAEADLNLDRAHELSLRAVKTDADNVVFLDTYAEVLFRKGRTPQAVAVIRRCIELEPEDGEHYHYLREQLKRFHPASSDSVL